MQVMNNHNQSKKIFVLEKSVGMKKVFTCPYENCGHQFTESSNLKTHIRIHVHLLHIIDR